MEALVEVVKANPGMRSLSLESNELGLVCAEVLAKLVTAGALHSLSLGDNNLADNTDLTGAESVAGIQVPFKHLATFYKVGWFTVLQQTPCL